MASSSPRDQGCQFFDKERSDACLRGFHSLFEQQVLCDVTLVAQGEDFQCHRAMLAASSPYFQVGITLLVLGLRTSTRASVYEAILACTRVRFKNSITREVLYYRPHNQTLV